MRPGILRRGRGGGPSRQVRFALTPGKEGEEEEEAVAAARGPPPPPSPSPLATPTLHRELPGGPPEPFDPPRAAAALLDSSFAARSAVGGATAAATNLPPAQRLFSGLISLAPPPLPAPRRGLQPPATPAKVPGPDLGVLGGAVGGLGEGEPWLPPPAAPLDPPRATPRPPGATFVMFQKLQQWGGG